MRADKGESKAGRILEYIKESVRQHSYVPQTSELRARFNCSGGFVSQVLTDYNKNPDAGLTSSGRPKKLQAYSWIEAEFAVHDKLPTAAAVAGRFKVSNRYAENLLAEVRMEKFGE